MRNNKGFSLIEVLVVLLVFSVLSILTTQTIVNTLRNSRKADAQAKIRANLEYASAVMERNLKNSLEVTCLSADKVIYTDQYNVEDIEFECIESGGVGYIASNSARLTNSDIDVDCTSVFTCVPPLNESRGSVDITLNATSVSTSGVEDTSVTLNTKVNLRN